MKNKNSKGYLRTSDLARAVGVHVNTVRLYEQWGLIPKAERSPSGYRRFTPHHLDCMRLARMVFAGAYPGRVLRRSGVEVIREVVAGDLGGALELAYQHKAQVQAEKAQAEAAAALRQRLELSSCLRRASGEVRMFCLRDNFQTSEYHYQI